MLEVTHTTQINLGARASAIGYRNNCESSIIDLFSVQMTPADIKNIREIAERDDVLELLAKSLAPSIYGHDHIKKALVLQLLVSRPLPEKATAVRFAYPCTRNAALVLNVHVLLFQYPVSPRQIRATR